jgi:hypothetical protein
MSGLAVLRAMPFLALAVLLYIIGTAVFGIGLGAGVLSFTLPSGAAVRFLFSDLVLTVALILFFVELLLSTRPSSATLINHGLSMALFVLCGVLFLLVELFGTTTFFVLTLLALIDVVSGYSISIVTARRDLTVEREV